MLLKEAKHKKEKLIGLKKEIGWLLGISKHYKKEIALVTLCSVLINVFSLTTSLCLKYIIDAVTGAKENNVLSIVVFAVGLMLSRIIFSALSSRVRAKISIKIQNEMQIKVYKNIFDAQWESLRDYRKGDLINRLNSDVSSVSSGIMNWFPMVLSYLTQFIYSFILIVSNDAVMAIIALLSAPFSALLSRFTLVKMRKHNLKIKELNADMISFQEDSFHNLQYIKAFGISNIINEKLANKQKVYKKENLDYNKVTITMQIIMSIVSMIITFISYAWGIYRLWGGFISYGTMVMFLQLTFSLSNSFSSMLKIIPYTINLGTSATRIIAIEELPIEETLTTDAERQFINKSFNTGVIINCKKVTFSYDNKKDVNIIEDCSFSTKIGETVAVIGDSGIGKTTLFRLILGLLQCNSGKIEFENIYKDTIQASPCTRELIAYVPQGNTIIDGTIAENLRLIKPTATDDEIVTVLKLSCAYEFVSKLPQGINSYIGESGKGFSEGQLQRISIARALIKDAPILLFDEVTSALDEETEKQLLKNIKTHCKNKTVIFVTHKINALEISDRILKIEDKKIKEVKYDIVGK